MTSKSWYFSLTREDLKRRVWLIALTALVLFFTFPVLTILYAGSIDGYENYQTGLIQFQWRLEEQLSLQNAWMFFMMVVCAIVYGLSGFSYLNSKSKVDFYHSIPVRREKLFLVHFINGFVLLAVQYLFFLGLSLIMGAANGADLSKLMKPALTAYTVNLAFFLLMYATVVVAVMMTGNRIVAILGTAVFFFYIPAMGALIEGFCSLWLLTYWSNGELILRSSRLSPFTLFLLSYTAKNPLSYGLAAAAAGIAISLFGLWLYKKRPSEGAGKSLVFPVSKPIIRIAIVLCSAMAGAIFGWGIRGTMSWSVFFLLCGCIVSHCVIEIIYHLDFKKLFSHVPQLIGCAAVSILVVMGFRFDLLGYDRYVPKAGNVSSVSMDIGNLDMWVEYGQLRDDYDYGLDWEWVDRTGYLLQKMELNDTAAAIELARIGSEQAVAYRNNAAETGYNRLFGYHSGYYNSEQIYRYVIMQFKTAGGRKTTRRYFIPMEQFADKLPDIYEQDNFKTAMYPLLSQQEDLAYVGYRKYGSNQDIFRGDNAKALELRAAYCEDLREQTIAARETEDPVASIRFVTAAEDGKLQAKELGGNTWERERIIWNNRYPVYPSFKRTLACLEAAGIRAEEMPEGLAFTGGQLSVYKYDYVEKPAQTETGLDYYEPEYVTIPLSAEEIAALMPDMVYDDDSNWNTLRMTQDRISVVVNVSRENPGTYNKTREDGGSTMVFYFIKDRVPESVKKKIESTL